MAVRKVKEGDTFVIEGVTYRFGLTSAKAYNNWLGLVGRGAPLEVEGMEIDVYTADRKSGRPFPPLKIKEALRNEQ